MRFAASKFVPLLLHTAMEPGDAVTLPGQIVDDCRRMGFRGCVLVGRTQLLAVREALQHTRSLGSPGQGRFRVAAGMELTLQVNRQSVSCVLIARDQIGWRFLLESLTRPPGSTGGLQLELDALKVVRGHVILLVRPEGAGIKPGVLKAIAKAMKVMVSIKVHRLQKVKKAKQRKVVKRVKKPIKRTKAIKVRLKIRAKREEKEREKRVPTTYLAMPGRDRLLERLGMNTGFQPVAAPDIHCTRLGHELLLSDWRGVLKMTDLNPLRCLTVNSTDALVRRFPGGRRFLARTSDILAAIEDFDFCVPAEPDAGATHQLNKLVHAGPRPRLRTAAPPDAYHERLREELRVIEEEGLARQFVTAFDITQRMRSAHVPSERHQGHLGNSLAARMLSLTTIDPVRDELLFRNFLMPGIVRKPSIDLIFGTGAKPILEAHLKRAYTCLDRPLQVIHLDLITCAERVSDLFKLKGNEHWALLEAMKKICVNVNSGAPKFDAPIPELKGLRRAIAITPILARLPGKIEPHPTDLLVNAWRPVSRGHRIAPIGSEDATAFGYLPITIATDPHQDALHQQRFALTGQQQKTVIEALHSRDATEALRIAIDMWSRDVRLFPPGYRLQHLMGGPNRPTTFHDLVALHGFLQDKEVDWNALLAHFKLSGEDSDYWYFEHPILKPIMAGTRGQILWDEQCFLVMTLGLRLTPEEAHQFMDNARVDPIGATERWQREATRIKQAAHIPRNPPPPEGVILHVSRARSSQRREMYERTQMKGHPPMSVKKAGVLHVIVGEALGFTRSNALAIAGAMRAYEQALL